jgi:phosphopantothenoylcysteine synthetase/decarboxylase
MTNKQTTTTNSFVESMKNIYEQLESSSQQKDIILKPIHQSPYRNAKSAYQRMIDPKEVTKECVIEMMKKLESSNNITTPLLKERTMFLQKNESGYKYFNKTYLFKSHGKIYIISGPTFFWQKIIDRSYEITTLGNLNREGEIYDINKKEYL